ncbi:MAG: CoA-binding protein [Jaaginema sp. PMC 1079.18]|nr:CoA-binding protein [Jaaginema sp. PMC 1080.18]MEC4851660.1 CoA-binding protein [Jaaginema sp. PMC 1079.18]MEC4867330.1 CoA-binding protein [Jaaginema sp. PMC 1078.18]
MQLTAETKVLIQGLDRPLGRHYAQRMKAYGTSVVAGVSVGQGGTTIHDIPCFNLVETAIAHEGDISTSVIFVEPYHVLDAALEAIESGIRQLAIVTAGIPPLDLMRLFEKAKATNTLILGPGSAGAIVPEKIWLGTCEPQFYTPGHVGIISRSDRLADEVALQLTQAQIGQSMAIHLGTGVMIGSSFQDWLKILADDPATEVILLIEQNGQGSHEAAQELQDLNLTKPIIAYVVGHQVPMTAPKSQAASEIASQLTCTIPHTNMAKQKIAAFKKAKIAIADYPRDLPDLIQKALTPKSSRRRTTSRSRKSTAKS